MRYVFLIVLFLIHPLGTQASETEGAIDVSNKYARVCHDETCTTFGTINFKPTINANTPGAEPVVVTDTEITGHAWGDEVGWILLNPTGAGVSVDPDSGILSGYAYAHTGGWLNFNPASVGGGTEVGVSITEDGEFYGWAWLSGAFGGWIKFDCNDSSTCVKTDWRPLSARTGDESEIVSGNTTGSRASTSTIDVGGETPVVPNSIENSRPPLTFPPPVAPLSPNSEGEVLPPLFQERPAGIPVVIKGMEKDEEDFQNQNSLSTQYRRLYLGKTPTLSDFTDVRPDCVFCIVMKNPPRDIGILKFNIIPETLEFRVPFSKFLSGTNPSSESFDIDALTAFLIILMSVCVIFVPLHLITSFFRIVQRTM